NDVASNSGKLLEKGLITEDEASKMKASGERLIIKIGDKKFTISEMAVATLLQRAGCSGRAFLKPDFQRNVFLAHSVLGNGNTRYSGERPQKISVVSRKVSDEKGHEYRKVFAFLGKYYSYIPQTVLITLTEELSKDGSLGEGSCKEWCINHEHTTLLLEFPEAADEIQDAYHLPEKMIPGLYLTTSDVGESSVTVCGTLRAEKSRYFAITDEVRKKHTAGLSPEAVVNEAKDKIFANVRVLPELLAELMGKALLDYTSIDLSTTEGREKNLEAVSGAYKKVVAQTAGKAFSGKTAKSLLDCLCSEIDPSRLYSAYDVAMSFLTLPDRVEGIKTDSDSFLLFQKLCSRAPFMVKDLKKTTSPAVSTPAAEEDEGDIFLV
ncbi:MAG: hypothetical protein ACI4CS_04340, partial [Candidatus Weimeria sp.]